MPERDKQQNIVWKLKIPVVSVIRSYAKYRAGKLSFLAFITVLIALFIGGLSCTQEGVEQCQPVREALQDVLNR